MSKTGLRRPIGILMLDTRFQRIRGDAGNEHTWDFPVIYRTVHHATALRVIDGEAHGLLDAFIAAGRELVEEGCAGISTTCGFLALYQHELAGALPVPVATSSLLQIPMIERVLPPGKRVGVITMDPARLTPKHMAEIGVAGDVAMEGLPRDGAFWRMIAENAPCHPSQLEQEVLAAGRRLLARRSDIGALLLECANMPPYAAELSAQFGLPVFDIVTMVNWLAQAVSPRSYPREQ